MFSIVGEYSFKKPSWRYQGNKKLHKTELVHFYQVSLYLEKSDRFPLKKSKNKNLHVTDILLDLEYSGFGLHTAIRDQVMSLRFIIHHHQGREDISFCMKVKRAYREPLHIRQAAS